MNVLRWSALALALILGGWLAFDGSRAFVVGDYVTPKMGEYAGKLGPWAKVVERMGIEPRSVLMKSLHIVLGIAWMVAAIGFLFRVPWAWGGMMACAVLTLWYLPFGTLIGITEIVLLLLPAIRDPGGLP